MALFPGELTERIGGHAQLEIVRVVNNGAGRERRRHARAPVDADKKSLDAMISYTEFNAWGRTPWSAADGPTGLGACIWLSYMVQLVDT